ncbi:MAG: hypothetical protein VKJ46_12025 [Leptolyngbyaceae bacterium]|nr:hypothetical protein [Leptolyngbyaceae bacterium]
MTDSTRLDRIETLLEQMAERQAEREEAHERFKTWAEAEVSQILAVQRDLQESDLRRRDELDRLTQIADRLVGYSISAESDRLTLEERMLNLERRMRRLEGPMDN